MKSKQEAVADSWRCSSCSSEPAEPLKDKFSRRLNDRRSSEQRSCCHVRYQPCRPCPSRAIGERQRVGSMLLDTCHCWPGTGSNCSATLTPGAGSTCYATLAQRPKATEWSPPTVCASLVVQPQISAVACSEAEAEAEARAANSRLLTTNPSYLTIHDKLSRPSL